MTVGEEEEDGCKLAVDAADDGFNDLAGIRSSSSSSKSESSSRFLVALVAGKLDEAAGVNCLAPASLFACSLAL